MVFMILQLTDVLKARMRDKKVCVFLQLAEYIFYFSGQLKKRPWQVLLDYTEK